MKSLKISSEETKPVFHALLSLLRERCSCCFTVESRACQLCAMTNEAKLTTPSGFIASVVTQESPVRCGSARCPWKIEVRGGGGWAGWGGGGRGGEKLGN